MNTKALNTQFATSFESDFEEGTWNFKMEQPFKVWSGHFAIMDKIEYDKLMEYVEMLEDAATFRQDCRNYLMEVPAEKVTVEDCLENLGYGRNGLGE